MDNIFRNDAGGDHVTLLASSSRNNGKGVFPRIPHNSPSAGLYEDTELSGPGTLYSYTVIHPNPKTGRPPFVLALVDYADTRVFGRLSHEPDKVRIGMPVAAAANKDESDAASGFHFIATQQEAQS